MTEPKETTSTQRQIMYGEIRRVIVSPTSYAMVYGRNDRRLRQYEGFWRNKGLIIQHDKPDDVRIEFVANNGTVSNIHEVCARCREDCKDLHTHWSGQMPDTEYCDRFVDNTCKVVDCETNEVIGYVARSAGTREHPRNENEVLFLASAGCERCRATRLLEDGARLLYLNNTPRDKPCDECRSWVDDRRPF